MTKLILLNLAVGGVLAFSSCAKDQPTTQTTSSTTETTTVPRPADTTTVTQTTAPAY
jgi:ABC-type glycerol-3-phosphate transport system substrate-binding protein